MRKIKGWRQKSGRSCLPVTPRFSFSAKPYTHLNNPITLVINCCLRHLILNDFSITRDFKTVTILHSIRAHNAMHMPCLLTKFLRFLLLIPPSKPMTSLHPIQPYSSLVRGFTLIEVMIVVTIVGILAAVALPSYSSYIRRGNLQDGFAQMSAFQLQMEQFYQDNRSYATSDGECPANLTAKLASKHFSFNCEANATTYVLSASGKSGSTTGYNYTINQANQRKTTSFAGKSQTLNCWADRSASCS